MSKPDRELRKAVAQLDAIYAQLPTIVCKGRCAIGCGAIPLTEVEARRLQVVTHRKPRTVAWLPALSDFAPAPARERCIYLSPAGDRCSAYAIRPLICRAWGLIRAMSCMHGCVPDRWLKDTEFLRLAQAVERIGGRLLRTTRDGLVDEGDSFLTIPVTRSEDAIEEDAERTRHLRALHGGRILFAGRTEER